MKVRRPHEKTSVLKTRFLDAVIVPVIRINEKKVAPTGLKVPIHPSG